MIVKKMCDCDQLTILKTEKLKRADAGVNYTTT